ncbi:MAG: peptidoglycan-binding protein [Actinobacteria bacterium]|nr:peptidoglycan-binding protein [Actinomycetota bacterium]
MRTLVPGDRGLAVGDVQKRLHDLGYSSTAFEAEMREAYYGESTSQAVRDFQEARGLRIEGSVDETTWQELVEASIRLGDRFLYLRIPPFRGDDVREVQRYLNRLGFNAGREDGIFGQDTDGALRAFQHNMGLPVDGIAGSSTISCLQRLKHALKETSVAEVHETLQDLAARGLEGKSVVLDAAEKDAGAEDALRLASSELLASGLMAHMTGGASAPLPESQRARVANDRKADLVLGLRMTPESGMHIYYFGSKGYSSPRGRRFAEILQGELAPVMDAEVPAPETKSYPLLRETRMPCVVLESGSEAAAGSDLAIAIARSIVLYFSPSE